MKCMLGSGVISKRFWEGERVMHFVICDLRIERDGIEYRWIDSMGAHWLYTEMFHAIKTKKAWNLYVVNVLGKICNSSYLLENFGQSMCLCGFQFWIVFQQFYSQSNVLLLILYMGHSTLCPLIFSRNGLIAQLIGLNGRHICSSTLNNAYLLSPIFCRFVGIPNIVSILIFRTH